MARKKTPGSAAGKTKQPGQSDTGPTPDAPHGGTVGTRPSGRPADIDAERGTWHRPDSDGVRSPGPAFDDDGDDESDDQDDGLDLDDDDPDNEDRDDDEEDVPATRRLRPRRQRPEEDEDDEDEGILGQPRRRGQRRAGPTPPAFTIDDSDPVVRDCLDALLTDPTAARALADRLEECGDGRHPSIRELAEVRCAVPAVTPRGAPLPMACGTFFVIQRDDGSVSGGPHPGTWQSAQIKGVCGKPVLQVHLPLQDRREGPIREVFEGVRRGMIYALMGTQEERVRARRAVLAHTRVAEIADELAEHEPDVAVRWACELRAAAPARFEKLFRHVRSRPDCREFFVALLNAIHPGWADGLLAGGR